MNNLLPYDGEAYYLGRIIPADEAGVFFHQLLTNIAWQHEEAIIYGRRIITKRLVAWYGNKAFAYAYSGITKQALPFTNHLLQLLQMAEKATEETFNSCLLNLYHTGEEGMGWHSDNETTLQPNRAIASVSLGAERRFMFRHKKTGETISVLLEEGSLLLMKGTAQTHWQHSLPKTKKVKAARINLTFRSMKE
ncbi:MAG: alpha-ketoglutarate-dependent dioxygenase AlkB [Bacteroidota bacterium]|nr:alpha-ketoglutarate-dependent dioxygenase AlkB [Bacteroidota bacterium]